MEAAEVIALLVLDRADQLRQFWDPLDELVHYGRR